MKTALLVHCDWSTTEKKRWACRAKWRDGSFHVSAPKAVGPLEGFFTALRSEEPVHGILTGFDLPIGVPRAYAKNAGIERFSDSLVTFGQGEFRDFYNPAAEACEVSVTRPFFPGRTVGPRKRQLVDGLGLSSPAELLRQCDRATSARPAACEIFWTLGAKQVGRAAISCWRDLLAPALRRNEITLWPFGGELPLLLESGGIVVVETYPTETYSHVGVRAGFGKRNQEKRAEQANSILSWCGRHDVNIEPALEWNIWDGFGRSQEAEDEFDSFIGVLGMIEVVQNPARFVVPDEPYIREMEGWILGLDGESISRCIPKVRATRAAVEGRLHQPETMVAASKICPGEDR